ncbi:MAG: DUF397 domain-containing protein, partial [Patescibacteria group bacterium]
MKHQSDATVKASNQGEAEKFIISSYCGGGGGCVGVCKLPNGQIAMGDTKNLAGGSLIFTGEEWVAFTKGANGNEF